MLSRKSSNNQLHSRWLLLLLPVVVTLVIGISANAQTPFYTDDADVTPRRDFHFEFSNEFDWLQRAVRPHLRQNTADFTLEYGLANNLEVGIESPWLTIFNERGTVPLTPSGIGDTNFSAKYNFLKERENSRLPAMTITFNIELPTGSVSQGLGSGLADYYGNGILQKSLSTKTKLRLNGGILFSGNETTGAIGIKTRGVVLTGGGSLVKQFNPKIQLGIELVGALNKSLELGKGQLQALFGGNYQLRHNISLDFGVLGGKFAASPRAGAKLGMSFDF